MNICQKKTMRDAFIEGIYQHMSQDERIYFLSADCGAPPLDNIRAEFSDRFRSVGIAEQNLINIATGLALEGFTVFAYGIAPFLSMRACEQVRTNLSLHAVFKTLNVNLISIGAGLSYDLSGPTHHCLEDISLIRLLPHIELFSPSDCKITAQYLETCLKDRKPRYLRFDSKPVPAIYDDKSQIDFQKGFCELVSGKEVGIISTGFMTHTALKAAKLLAEKGINISVIDLFLVKSYDEDALYERLQHVSYLLTLEEAFISRGGMDASISELLRRKNNKTIHLESLGIYDTHVFELGGREHLHQLHGLDALSLVRKIETYLGNEDSCL